MVEKILLILLIVFAFLAIQSNKLRRAVVFLGAFSALSAFLYILMGAPDAALAEAVIGSTIATIIYLAVIQKYRVFTVYFTNESQNSANDTHVTRRQNSVLVFIEKFCYKRELEPQIVYTIEDLEKVKEKDDWDLIVRRNRKMIKIYGNTNSYQFEELIKYVEKRKEILIMGGYIVELIKVGEEDE